MVTGLDLADDALKFLWIITYSELNPRNSCQVFNLVLIPGQSSLDPREERRKTSCQQQLLGNDLKKHFSLSAIICSSSLCMGSR